MSIEIFNRQDGLGQFLGRKGGRERKEEGGKSRGPVFCQNLASVYKDEKKCSDTKQHSLPSATIQTRLNRSKRRGGPARQSNTHQPRTHIDVTTTTTHTKHTHPTHKAKSKAEEGGYDKPK